MPLDVLQPVSRRPRRRRRRLLPLLLLVLVLAGAAGAGVWYFRFRSHGGAPARPPARVAGAPARPAARKPPAPRRRPRPVGPLVYAPAHVPTRPALANDSRGAILVDGDTGRVLWRRYPHRRLPIASVTKIMTAVLALERLRPRTIVRVTPAATRVALVREGLRAGERVQAWKLFYGLLLYSGNDDALALAVASGGTRAAFIREMNAKARALGLHDTHFSTPSGVVDRGNYSSVWDLAGLTRYALRNVRFRTIVRTRVEHVPWAAPTYSKIYVNKNPLLGHYAGANGVKTGWTTLAGHCLVASATRGRVHLIAVVLHAGDPAGDARRLLDYGFRTRG